MLVKDLIRRKSRWPKTMWIALIERRNLECAAVVHLTVGDRDGGPSCIRVRTAAADCDTERRHAPDGVVG
jgi:hypothetical protein